jgi:hypothetical protein
MIILIPTAKYPCMETGKGILIGSGKKQNNLPITFKLFKEIDRPTLGINL